MRGVGSEQVREKDDRVRQRKLETFLKPCGEASSAVPTGTDDMEVIIRSDSPQLFLPGCLASPLALSDLLFKKC